MSGHRIENPKVLEHRCPYCEKMVVLECWDVQEYDELVECYLCKGQFVATYTIEVDIGIREIQGERERPDIPSAHLKVVDADQTGE